MAAVPPRFERRRPRPGSLERPVNARLYRGTWLLVGLPLLLLAFTIGHPGALSRPALPPGFDRTSAVELARDLAQTNPDRSPGTIGSVAWLRRQLRPYGLRAHEERFTASIPGRGRVVLRNVVVVVPGRSQNAIVVMAHRDDAGTGPGANDNASGTAALVELARSYTAPSAGGTPRVSPAHTLLFLSTDGGAFGALGAAEFVHHSAYVDDVVAVVNLDSVAGTGPPRLEIGSDTPRSPAASLVETAASRLLAESGREPGRPSALRQLVDLGFPFALYEQAPFVAHGIPAVTITTAGDRPPSAFGDTPDRLDGVRLAAIGRAAQDVLASLDQGLELAQGTSTYLYLGPRIVRGWAIEIVLFAMLLPFLAAVVDLFARCRRRRIPLAPALRSFRSRLGFWVWTLLVFEFFALVGVWPRGEGRPLAPGTPAAGDWPRLGVLGLAAAMLVGWLVTRQRLLPRRTVSAEEELAGQTAALLALAVLALLVVAVNAFALVFLLPALHAWLWLPHAQTRPAWARALVLAAGLLGPLLLLWSFAARYGLGLDAPWYIAELAAIGYVPFPYVLLATGWWAVGAQLAAVAGKRYAPYPTAAERPPRGPIRETIRRVVLAVRDRRRASQAGPRALEG
jgi:hypothetical protein